MFVLDERSILLHYGVKRRSGRYPWGSGDDPNQHESGFLNEYETLKSKGLSEIEIANKLNINTTQLRNTITWARKEQREFLQNQVGVLKESGMSNVMVAQKLGISEATVRNYIAPKEKVTTLQLDNISDAVKNGVDNTGYLDVGVGVERQLGVSRTKFNTVVNKMIEDEGYHLHEVYVKRLSDPSKYTTVKVLTKESNIDVVKLDSDKIRPLDSWSDDASQTINNLRAPEMVGLDRIKIRYAEEGGAEKDGLIELRPGVKDLDMGSSRYAQVRIGVKDNSNPDSPDLYLKGMAAYTDDKFPPGVDIIFNTNKSLGTPPESVLKKMKDDADNPFGTTIKPKGQRGALNIVNEEGDWDTWSTKMSSQFLSKQPVSLIKEQLEATTRTLQKEFDEINSLTNPTVRKHLLDSYIDGLDAKAAHLKAQGLPRTKNHVLLPVTDLKPNEIFAPLYKNGERVVLVRHPHAGTFEIPELIVNNRSSSIAKRMIGLDAPDAVGIHPSVAGKLSGADFDGDTALVIPNNKGKIKTSRSLAELKDWGDKMHGLYKRDYQTITDKAKQTQMGIVSNLITDMTIKGASNSELARAVKHSMVVIDSEKHKLDYKQSARDHGINALRKAYQSNINPDTGKQSRSASTIISRSKTKIDISQHDTVRNLSKNKVDGNGKVLKKGLTTSEIATKLKISESTVDGYLKGALFNPDKYSSGRAREQPYVDYIKSIQSIKNTAVKTHGAIKNPQYSKEAAKVYDAEVKSLNVKLNKALLNAPRERQAQLLTNSLYYKNLKPEMDKDDKKKLKTRSLARARVTVGAERSVITITDNEWEAIQSRAISNTKLTQILNHADMDVVRKLATPRPSGISSANASRAKSMLSRGYTYAEVAESLGVSTSTIRNIVNE